MIEPRIFYTPGVDPAEYCDDLKTIFLNEDLVDYPGLRDYYLSHELRHHANHERRVHEIRKVLRDLAIDLDQARYPPWVQRESVKFESRNPDLDRRRSQSWVYDRLYDILHVFVDIYLSLMEVSR